MICNQEIWEKPENIKSLSLRMSALIGDLLFAFPLPCLGDPVLLNVIIVCTVE